MKQKTLRMSQRVEWLFQDLSGQMVPFNPHNNLLLEEALERQENISIKINNQLYLVHVMTRNAVSAQGHQVELLRKDKKGECLRFSVCSFQTTTFH